MSNIETVNRYLNGWIARDADAVLATLDDTGTYEDPSSGGPISGAAFRAYMEGLWAVFPDLTFETESVGEMAPDLIAAQWLMRGTNTGSMMGLPPTGKTVTLRGADFFRMKNGQIQSVTGYFDGGAVPRQLGLDIIVQPKEIGPFRFGISTSVQTGKLQEPGAFSITSLEARDAEAVQKVREGSRASLIDMLKMDGFIGATTAVIGTRMVTISAWDTPESSRRVMKEGAHSEAQKGFYDGSLARHGFTSVWTKERMNPYWVRCEACGAMNRRKPSDAAQACSCGATLPPPAPFW
ncbi:MAG: ester cyclase [Alphaproteobacteria bacterium]|nr:ester cyclase [Alphaproteobacteria bacterium]